MESRALTIGWIALLIMGIFLIASAVLSVVASDSYIKPAFEEYTGQDWDDFDAKNPKPADMYRLVVAAVSSGLLGFGILTVGLALRPYRRGERWAWYAVLVAGVLALAGFWSTNIIIGDPFPIVNTIVATIIFIIAIAVPARVFLGQR